MTKPVSFINKRAKKEFGKMPEDVKDEFAADFQALSLNRRPFRATAPLSSSVGPAVFELKINGSPAFRCVYIAKFADTIYILHTFKKTTNDVDLKAMKTAKERYKLLKQQYKNPKSNIFAKALRFFSL